MGLHNIKTALEPLVTQLCTNEKFHSSVQRPAELDPFPPSNQAMSILRSLPGLRDTGLIGSKGDRETIWERLEKKPLCAPSQPQTPPPTPSLPVLTILVRSKVFAQVLMATDDVEIIVMEACWMKRPLFI